MLRVNYACVLLIGLAAAFPACGGDDDDDDNDGGAGESSNAGTGGTGGSSSGKGGTGGSSSGKGGTGGSSGTTGTPVECADGDENYYDVWYGNEACAAYFDCYFDWLCSMAGVDEATCRAQVNESLSTAWCYPEGTEPPDDETLTIACNQARQSIAAVAATCAE